MLFRKTAILLTMPRLGQFKPPVDCIRGRRNLMGIKDRVPRLRELLSDHSVIRPCDYFSKSQTQWHIAGIERPESRDKQNIRCLKIMPHFIGRDDPLVGPDSIFPPGPATHVKFSPDWKMLLLCLE